MCVNRSSTISSSIFSTNGTKTISLPYFSRNIFIPVGLNSFNRPRIDYIEHDLSGVGEGGGGEKDKGGYCICLFDVVFTVLQSPSGSTHILSFSLMFVHPMSLVFETMKSINTKEVKGTCWPRNLSKFNCTQ